MKTTICTAAQARLADKTAIHEHKIPSLILMEHAALGCTKIIQKHLQPGGQILILCGPGNNGGGGSMPLKLHPCQMMKESSGICWKRMNRFTSHPLKKLCL